MILYNIIVGRVFEHGMISLIDLSKHKRAYET